MAARLTLAVVVDVADFIVKAPAAIVPLAVYPVPLRVIDWPGTAVAGVTDMERNPIDKSKLASLPARSMSTLWTPSPMEAGTLNLNGTRALVEPLEGIAVIEVTVSAATPPMVTLAAPVMVSAAVKSTRATVTVDPGLEDVDVGVAPAFCVKEVVLTWLIPLLSVIQTNPPSLVVELKRTVPEKAPVESIEPDPLNATPPVPVVGAVPLDCGLNRILQSVQLVLNPTPVTVTVAPRAAVEGLNFEVFVIAFNDDVMAMVSSEDFTVNVPVVLEAVCAAWNTLGLTMPAACVNVITTSAPTPVLDPMPSSPVPVAVSMSGTVMVTARPLTVIDEALFNRPAVPDPPLTTAAFNLTAEAAIDDGTVNLEPNVTVKVPPTGIAVIPAPPDTPVTVIVY